MCIELVQATETIHINFQDAIMKIMHNVSVYTMDKNFSTGDAIAWENDKIIEVGKKQDLLEKYKESKQIDGQGATLLPGFIDPHIHFLDGLIYQGALDCSPEKAPTIQRLKKLLQESAGQCEKGQWVVAHGYDPWEYPGKKTPSRHDLDDACPDHPAVIIHYSVHECVANSRALQLAGIDKNTPQPFAGEIKKDRKGHPTGHLIETAMGSVLKQSRESLIENTRAGIMQRLVKMQRSLFEFGITRIGDPAVQTTSRALYQEACDEGLLKIPAVLYPCNDENMLELPWDKVNQPQPWKGSEQLMTGPLKIFLDGADRAAMVLDVRQFFKTVLMTFLASIQTLSLNPIKTSMRSPVKPGRDLKFHFGVMMADTAKCRDLVSKALEQNYTLAFHAIGNEAIKQAIEMIAVEGNKHRNNPPPRIEHCLFLNDEMIRRIKELNITVVTQPYFLTHMSKENVPHLPGIKQLPLKSFLDAGVRVAGSSDWPVASCNPLLGIERAVTRVTKNNETLQKCESISVREAFAMYTSEAAFALGLNHDIGSLESGKRADFILLSENPFSADTIKWKNLNVTGTFLGGEKVFSRVPDKI